MKRMALVLAIFLLLCNILAFPATAIEIDPVTPNAYEIPFACPYCGALGYPTGHISFAHPGDIEPMLFPIYQVYQCSENPEHVWNVYLADAVT